MVEDITLRFVHGLVSALQSISKLDSELLRDIFRGPSIPSSS